MFAKRAHDSRLIVFCYGLLQVSFINIPDGYIFANEDTARRSDSSESNLKKEGKWLTKMQN